MDNESFSNQPALTFKTPKPKKTSKSLITGIIGFAAGAAIGVGITLGITFGINNHNQPIEQAKCDCDKALSSDINYSFLQIESASDNIIYSPLSIRNGLELLKTGANSNTKTEIEDVLGNDITPKYENIPGEISLANAVFIKDSFKENVLPTFTSAVKDDLDSEVIFDSFTDSTNMDNWVQKKTFNLLNNIGIKPTADTRMVLANALGLQLDWRSGFDSDSTRGADFYLKDNSKINATTMSKKTKSKMFNYKIDDDITAVSMPLKSSSKDAELEFIAIMPSGGLDNYIEKLDQTKIDDIILNLTPASSPEDGIVIYIPKFKFEYELDFVNALKAIGIKTAFSERADFSKMSNKPLYVSDAVHKSTIDFSEDGIKAAAITAFLANEATAMEGPTREPKPIIINIDHPFLFFIRDKKNDTIWFTGAVYQPNLWEDDVSDYMYTN